LQLFKYSSDHDNDLGQLLRNPNGALKPEGAEVAAQKYPSPWKHSYTKHRTDITLKDQEHENVAGSIYQA
jgi:hypothetical protein